MASLAVFFSLVFCHLLGLAFFFFGFLPTKPIIYSKNDHESKKIGDVWQWKEQTQQQDEKGKFQEEEQSFKKHKESMVTQPFSKLIIMIIDALREDFVFRDSRMPFLTDLLKSNKTFSFVSKSNHPTVTLPRIKALLTGTVSGYIDVVLNLASTELKEDNIIAKFQNSKKRLIFFGDDTWLKLLPNSFLRHDGTTSFVVSDYTEVDNNVTRHLDSEFAQNDWDVMVLHYLGLDHIGHSSGPTSPLIGPKLFEMDEIVRKILTRLEQRDNAHGENSLFVLTSDHGMNSVGGHGGATTLEVMTPLVFMSPSFKEGKGEAFTRKMVSQVDFAATISALFDLPIPENCIGKIIPELIKSFPVDFRQKKHREDACRLAKLSNGRKIQKDLTKRLQSLCELNSTKLRDNLTILAHIKEVSLALQDQASEYNVSFMFIGFLFLGASLLLAFVECKTIIRTMQSTFGAVDICALISVMLHWASMTSTSFIEEEHQVWYFTVTTTMFLVLIGSLIESLKVSPRSGSLSKENNSKDTEESLMKMKIATTATRTGGSTFKIFFMILSTLVMFRITRAWNQTGIKWLASSDISDYFLLPANKTIFVALMVSSSVITTICFCSQSVTCIEQIIFATGMLSIVMQKLNSYLHTESILGIDGTSAAQMVYILCIVCCSRSFIIWLPNSFTDHCWKSVSSLLFTKGQHSTTDNRNVSNENVFTKEGDNIAREKDSFTQSHRQERDMGKSDSSLKLVFLLLYMNVLRPHNIIWFGMVLIIERATSEAIKRFHNGPLDLGIIVLYYSFGKACYYAQGNSNAISCVDVAAGLIGMKYYIPVIAGSLTMIATFGAQMFWFVSLVELSKRSNTSRMLACWKISVVYSTILIAESFSFALIVYINRYHLFIWSVFAPKFLFLVTSNALFVIILIVYVLIELLTEVDEN
eukprot:Seg2482.3 transcript_id=Seg2482.3/GoldUCD/mRNA.D3Y31 product="GPI ethanolamine phosphate transferase 2" protein_id=Seg2482.3/GoldUCD/D3Y31